MKTQTKKLIFFLTILEFVFPTQVYAYIDPGSGSYFTQIILGILLGGVFWWRNIVNRLKSIFMKKQSNIQPTGRTNGKNKLHKKS